ncbi:hypothetical protein RND81_09G193700 [Saponaria officinalis]|uniref:Uncharacterized protein n=1 Tax=Saponaria officinalis TaxID=3572 RepID=A0AAW1IPY2_SAPOF
MRFFIEFYIPYIWRSCPTTGYTSMLTKKLYCLKRKAFSKFWDTMIKKDPKNPDGQLNCQPTLNVIMDKIQALTQLKQIRDDESRTNDKGKLLEFLDDDDEINLDLSESSDKEIIKTYMDALKKTLKARKEEADYMNNFANSSHMDKGSTSDVSMTSDKSHLSLKDFLQDAQDPNDDSQIEKIKTFLDIN